MATEHGSLKGTTLKNRYKFLDQIGSGIYATVYAVEDLEAENESETRKAIKVVTHSQLSQNVVAEGKLLMENPHPHMIKVYDIIFMDNNLYIVMEYCDGGDLARVIYNAKSDKKPIPQHKIIRWLIQLLKCLQFIHSRGIIHRDIKPRNILIQQDNIKLGDFGVSRVLTDTSESPHSMVGTAGYMSPEMIRSEGYNEKYDIWSVGCVLYELVALQRAFLGKDVIDIFAKIVNMELPAWPAGYSEELHSIFKRTLTKEPDDRPTADELLNTTFLYRNMDPDLDSLMVPFGGAAAKKMKQKAKEKLRRFFRRSIDTADNFVYGVEPLAPEEKSVVTETVSSTERPLSDLLESQIRIEDSADCDNEQFSARYRGIADEMQTTHNDDLMLGSSGTSQMPQGYHNVPTDRPTKGLPSFSVPSAQSSEATTSSASDDYVVNFIVRQKAVEPEAIYIDCCKKQLTKERLEELQSLGYTKGPMKSKDIILKDKSNILVTTSGPVQLEVDGTGIEHCNILFDSELDNAGEEGWMTPAYLEEQQTRSHRGYVNFSILKSNISSTERHRSGSRLSEAVDYVLLCALPLVITTSEQGEHIEKIEKKEVQSQAAAPESEKFWNPVVSVAKALKGNDWVRLAKELHYDAVGIREFQERGSDIDAVAYMLLDWLGRTPDMTDKIGTLSAALQTIGHKDVANIIKQREKGAQEERKFLRVVDVLVDDAALLRDQNQFLRTLGLSDADILEASSLLVTKSLKGALREGLKLWRNHRGTEASINKIIECLEEMKLKNLAEIISDHHLKEPS